MIKKMLKALIAVFFSLNLLAGSVFALSPLDSVLDIFNKANQLKNQVEKTQSEIERLKRSGNNTGNRTNTGSNTGQSAGQNIEIRSTVDRETLFKEVNDIQFLAKRSYQRLINLAESLGSFYSDILNSNRGKTYKELVNAESSLSFILNKTHRCKDRMYDIYGLSTAIINPPTPYSTKNLIDYTREAIFFFNQIAEKLPEVMDALDAFAKRQKNTKAIVIKEQIAETIAQQYQDIDTIAKKIEKTFGVTLPPVIEVKLK